MAAVVYRYRWLGIDPVDIFSQIPPGPSAIPGFPSTQTFLDITYDTSFPKADLDSILLRKGWVYFSTNPSIYASLLQGSGSPEGSVSAGPGSLYQDIDTNSSPNTTASLFVKLTGSGNTGWYGIGSGLVTRQVIEERLTTDQSTSSGTLSDLLSISITTLSGFLEIYASASVTGSNSGSLVLDLDGTTIPNGGAGILSNLGNPNIIKRVAVSAGSHTVKLRWSTGGSGNVQCRPVTQSSTEHATLLVRETS